MTSYTHTVRTHTIDQAQLTDDARAIVQGIRDAVTYGAWLFALPILTHVAIVQWILTSAYQSAMAGYRGTAKRIPVNAILTPVQPIAIVHLDDTLDLPLTSAIPQLATSLPCNIDGYPCDDMMWSQYGLTPYALPTAPRKTDLVVTMAANDIVDPAPVKAKQPASKIKLVNKGDGHYGTVDGRVEITKHVYDDVAGKRRRKLTAWILRLDGKHIGDYDLQKDAIDKAQRLLTTA
jgi:hypothetical protein